MSIEDQFSQRLQEEITWRVRELSELVRVCAEGGVVRQNALSRAALPILYAHWEGYFVVSANVYLSFLTQKRMVLSSLRDEFWALAIRKRFKPNQVGGDVNFNRFLMSIKAEPDRIFKKGNYEKINGGSNLNSDVLTFCCQSIGIEVEPFTPYFSFIDDMLIKKRNHIAHGEALRFASKDIPGYREKVVELMRIAQTQFENAGHSGSYRRSA